MRKAINLLTFLTLLTLLLVQIGCSSDDEEPAAPPPACSIVLDDFNSWEYFFTGEDINIRWTKTTGGTVKIDLLKGGNPVGVITPSTSNNGYYPWLNSTTFGQGTGEDYAIRLTSLDDGTCGDETNPFELIDVSNCFIKFPWTEKDTIPDQTAGTLFNITWDSANTTGKVDLELWYEPFAGTGVLVGVIAENTDDDGLFEWTVDSFNRGTDGGYRLKIRDVDFPRCGDRSVPFAIFDDEVCSIDVLGVNGGQVYAPGDNIPLTFALENSSGLVKLKLYSGNLPVNEPPQNGIITESFDTENGTAIYNWSVTTLNHSGPAYNRFNIRAFDLEDEYCVGVSSEFTISQ